MSDLENRQIERYRQMTGEQRLRIGLGLFESSLDIAREAVRNQFPDANDEAIEMKVQHRIRVGYEIQRRPKSP